MTGPFPPQPWMTASETVRVLDALTADGAEARFVGGCVRDALAGRAVKDIDIATDAPPETVLDLLSAAGIKSVPTGLAHGTVTAVVAHRPFEITTLRRDIETDGRHAQVAYGTDWRADAERRDFTMNAITLTRDGVLYDFHDGVADLHAGRVRFVGDARRRIAEDVLRLLRWFRFYAHFGSPAAGDVGHDGVGEVAVRRGILSRERVRQEVLSLLAAPDPLPALELMRETEVMDHILPGVGDLTRIGGLVRITGGDVPADPILRLATLLEAAAADEIVARLRLSNREADRLRAALADADNVAPGIDANALEAVLYRQGKAGVRDRAWLGWAGASEEAGWADLLRTIKEWTRPTFPISGADLDTLGIPEGPRVGKLLGTVEDWWIEGGFSADRAACIDRLRAAADLSD